VACGFCRRSETETARRAARAAEKRPVYVVQHKHRCFIQTPIRGGTHKDKYGIALFLPPLSDFVIIIICPFQIHGEQSPRLVCSRSLRLLTVHVFKLVLLGGLIFCHAGVNVKTEGDHQVRETDLDPFLSLLPDISLA
jgi:hypothetical protein